MSPTVEIILIRGTHADTIRCMRLGPDHHEIAAHAFHQSGRPEDWPLHIEFSAGEAADRFCRYFSERVLETMPEHSAHRNAIHSIFPRALTT